MISVIRPKLALPTSAAAASPTQSGRQPRMRSLARPVPRPTPAIAVARHQPAVTSAPARNPRQVSRSSDQERPRAQVAHRPDGGHRQEADDEQRDHLVPLRFACGCAAAGPRPRWYSMAIKGITPAMKRLRTSLTTVTVSSTSGTPYCCP